MASAIRSAKGAPRAASSMAGAANPLREQTAIAAGTIGRIGTTIEAGVTTEASTASGPA